MGAIYLAARADDFEKQSRLKSSSAEWTPTRLSSRFRNERQIFAKLEHPNIARLIDGGTTEDGLPYLVMEYVEGEPLTKYCEAKELTIEQRLKLFLQICSAVKYAHQNLIIHRDLKPSNVLVTKDGTPKLLDFGIAKLIADEANGETQPNTITRVMTPEYASPEQVQGKQITTSTDVYSLGVMLYELLTGERPFRVKTKNADEISKIITDSPPMRPSSGFKKSRKRKGQRAKIQNPHSPISNLKGDLDNIILMAMRKEPERRYSSVEQFAGDIQRYLEGLPVIAQEDTFSYRASKNLSLATKPALPRNRRIAVSLIGGIISIRANRKSPKQRERFIGSA